MELDSLPVIDHDLSTRLAGNKKELADEMLALLVSTLPGDISSIKTQYEDKNHPELLRQVHKLHGAICYCGLPRLKTVLNNLETELKNNIMEDRLTFLINQLLTETSLLIEQYASQERA